ncbi:hypothetical protein [Absidia glauca]|uniref:G-protein coupled receptors family 1 profile domain-containing protein n=1 Tax=Absidia glauca TaxID=4829 RepID=A0A168P2D3_ABSGL|nr:hypothetical protein [Absidia glauca]
MLGALTGYELASIILESVVVSYAFELCVRNLLLLKNDKTLGIHIGKALLGFFFAIKTSFFLSFYTDQGPSCYITARFADIFYHLGMVAGDYVLLSRVHAVIPPPWKTASYYSMLLLLVLRLTVGVVDVVLLHVGYDEHGKCIYIDNYYVSVCDENKAAGPVYTFLDLFIDMYVSVMITYILVSHIRRLENAHLPVNVTVYIAVVSHNVIRTVMLTVVNVISGIFLINKMSNDSIMLVWPIINLFVVLLIGYDSDLTKTIVKLKDQYWRKVNSMLSSATIGTPLVMESVMANPARQPMWKSSPDLPLRTPPSIYSSSSQQNRF